MANDIPIGDKKAFSRIESYHQTHYYEQLSNCIACLFDQKFTKMEIEVWSNQLHDLAILNDSFLDQLVRHMENHQSDRHFFQTIIDGSGQIGSQLFNKVKGYLPANLWLFNIANPVIGTVKLANQVSEFLFTTHIEESITFFLINQFKKTSSQTLTKASEIVSQSLETNHSLSDKILAVSQTLSKDLLKLFLFREMLLQGKLTRQEQEQAVRKTFLEQAGLQHQREEKIAAIVEIYFLKQLNLLFERHFKDLFDYQQTLLEEEKNDFDRWLGGLFESDETRQLFSRQIQQHFLQTTRDFFLQKLNEKSQLGKHPYLYSTAIGLTLAIMAISILALTCHSLTFFALCSTTLSFFAVCFTVSALLINQIHRLYYARSASQRQMLQKDVDLINQNISKIHEVIESRKQTSSQSIDWLEKLETINSTLFENHHVMLGFHEAWVREYAARYRHSKAISSDLKETIIHLIDQSAHQSQSIANALLHHKPRIWQHYFAGTENFITHPANQETVESFEFKLKLREQCLHIAANLPIIPPQLSHFYVTVLDGQVADLTNIHHIQQQDDQPYTQLCRSAQRLYQLKEGALHDQQRFHGDPDYRNLLRMPNLITQPKVKAVEISTYLRNSLHFLLSLNHPIAPGMGLNPLQQPSIPTPEFYLYRMLLFRQLASIYFAKDHYQSQTIRVYIESFLKRHFQVSAKQVFDDLMNQAYYLPADAIYPTTTVCDQTYVVEQLDYIVQALTLDMACHTTAITPSQVLLCYSEDYQEAIDQTQPLKLLALSLKRGDLCVQQSRTFERYIETTIENTNGFIQYLQHNDIPKSYINCYQFQIIEQLVALQLDIIVQTHQAGVHSKAYPLINLWHKIDEFLNEQPYRLNQHSGLGRLFNLFRLNPKAIYAFTLPASQMRDFQDQIKSLLMSGQPSLSSQSVWAKVDNSCSTKDKCIEPSTVSI